MQTIPYKIDQIKISQFAVFPDKYVNGEEVQIHASFSFLVPHSISQFFSASIPAESVTVAPKCKK